jgi:hypothetical protein
VCPPIGHPPRVCHAVLESLYRLRHLSKQQCPYGPLMLFLLLLQFGTTHAAPLPVALSQSTSNTCADVDNCRTRWNIIWSCLATILLCTWTSLHPNIPEPINRNNMNWWQNLKSKALAVIVEQMPLFICALIVPEYILAWAIRQFLVAWEIGKDTGP